MDFVDLLTLFVTLLCLILVFDLGSISFCWWLLNYLISVLFCC